MLLVKRYLVYKVKTVKPPKKSEEKEKKEVRLRARKRDGTGLLGCGFVSRVRNLWIELARIAIRIWIKILLCVLVPEKSRDRTRVSSRDSTRLIPFPFTCNLPVISRQLLRMEQNC